MKMSLGAIRVPIHVVLLVCITASFKHGWGDMLSIVTAVHNANGGLPITAALQFTCIVTMPMVSNPPAIGIVDVRSMTMAISVVVCVALVA